MVDRVCRAIADLGKKKPTNWWRSEDDTTVEPANPVIVIDITDDGRAAMARLGQQRLWWQRLRHNCRSSLVRSLPTPSRLADQDCKKASRSALIVSAWVVGMPCGNPEYVFSVPFCTSCADSGPESA